MSSYDTKKRQKKKNLERYALLNKRIGCDVRNTTLIILVTAHPNVTLVTPRFTPGIFCNVIILLDRTIGNRVITNKKERMV